MVTLKRVGLRSAGRVGFWLGVAFAIVNFTIFLFFLLVIAGIPLNLLDVQFWLRVALSLFFSGLNSAISFGIMAFFYNWVSKSFGGLELEFDSLDMPTEKRKNDAAPIMEDESDML